MIRVIQRTGMPNSGRMRYPISRPARIGSSSVRYSNPIPAGVTRSRLRGREKKSKTSSRGRGMNSWAVSEWVLIGGWRRGAATASAMAAPASRLVRPSAGRRCRASGRAGAAARLPRSPTRTYTMLESTFVSPKSLPVIAATRSNFAIPTSSQLSPPTMTRPRKRRLRYRMGGDSIGGGAPLCRGLVQ